ncbi:helix-turn-helix domain-containing protein [Marinilabilia rubra]|uniref:HTH araC/xylS-type domain-containing protein n=1 Tax=Marinilabilia rubra TaxID=2162893 RepID=A0A2U2B7R8_9BACT|nr:helix-turn-helix domain-containing protein [Marinilabilia rubra]PWD99107.1 hypothetical protein DDZ16_12710 [Marinilabilia rubra]
MDADFLLVIAVFESLFLLFLVLTKKHKKQSDWLLGTILFINALTIFLSWMEMYNRKNAYPFPFFINSSTPFILLHGPALWLYVKSLTSEKFSLKPKYLIHALPFLMLFTFLSLAYYSLAPEDKILSDSQQLFQQRLSYPITILAILVFTQYYIISSLLHIKRYRKKAKTVFSSMDNFNLKWLRFVLFSAMIFYATISATYILDYFLSIFPYKILQLIGFTIASIYILVLGFQGLKQGNIFSSHNLENIPSVAPIKQKKPLLKKEEIFVTSLLQYMNDQEPFLNPDLTLSTLAKELSVTPEYLSDILNGHLKSSFFDFINQFRVEKFKALCKTNKQETLTLIAIAYECGFNSKATFNRVFKKRTGITPGEYSRQVSES